MCLESKTVALCHQFLLSIIKLLLSIKSASLQKKWLLSKAKTCYRSYQQETLSGLPILNPHSLGRKKIALADITIFLMLTVFQYT